MRNPLCPALAIVAALALCPRFAAAQTEPRGGSLFGGAAASSADSRNLNLTINLAEGYDQDVSERFGNISQTFQGRGSYATLVPQLEFKSSGRRVRFNVTSGASVRYYGDVHETILTNQTNGTGLSLELTPRTSVTLNQGVTYSQDLFYGLFTGAVAPPAGSPAFVDASSSSSSYDVNMRRSYTYSAGTSVTQKISERASMVFDAEFAYNHYTGHDPRYPDLRTQGARGHLLYGLSKGVKFRVGYALKRGQFIGTPVITEHDLDVGLDYVRALSRTRKTTIAFTFGPSITNGTLSSGTLDLRRQYRLIGDAALTHQIGRTWSVQANYRRAVGYYIEGLQSRVFTENYGAAASGLLNRRVDLSLSASYSTGQPELTGTPAAFSTYTGDARLRFALGHTWATYAEYLFYLYSFDKEFALPTGVPPRFTRNSARAGFTLWLPMMRHP